MARKFNVNDRVVVVESSVATDHPILRASRFAGMAGVVVEAMDYNSPKHHNDYLVQLDGTSGRNYVEEPYLMLESEYWRLDNVAFWRQSAEGWSQIGRNFLIDGKHADAAMCFSRASQDMCRSRNSMHYLDAVA